MIVVAVNQIGIAQISFNPPEIDLSQTSPTLVTTYGTDVITLKGKNFGAHPDIADTYQTNSVSHLVVDSALGPQQSGSGLTLLSWNHTTIQFLAPESDGKNWDLTLTTGGQIHTRPSLLHYMPPNILQITPNENVMTDGRDGKENV